ncbi:MAG: hypothetical protein WAO02_06540 [Verrucomicrobiia bacterium]
MKPIRTNRGKYVFSINPQEKLLLDEVLKLYPLISASHHRLSRKSNVVQPNDHQRLLEESLATQREVNRKNVQAMLNQPGHFKTTASGGQLTLSGPEIEWLLQVLNDVRVGSWIALGSPDPERDKEIVFNNKMLPHFRMMELAGAFETVFLDALSGREPK